MEGTENLDDEVYNKRHMRLEIDERRRKRLVSKPKQKELLHSCRKV